jgi:hypothetical protein
MRRAPSTLDNTVETRIIVTASSVSTNGFNCWNVFAHRSFNVSSGSTRLRPFDLIVSDGAPKRGIQTDCCDLNW